MKRIALLLLSLLLLVGCVGAGAQAAGLSPLQAPSDPPASTPEPQHDGPFLSYHFYEQPNWESITSGTLFSCDLDQDGQEEPVTFQLRPNDEWATAITWNGKTTIIDGGDELVSAEVLDLDPVSPWYNLLVTVDYGSDSYVTVELHPEDGQLVLGKTIDGDYAWREGALWFSERSDLLGTNFGERSYHGDDLVPDSEWLTMSYIPTQEELETEQEELIDVGSLIHCACDVPCYIDGKLATLPQDTLLYCVRFMDPNVDLIMEVCTLDGTIAQLRFYDDEDEPHEADRIFTMEIESYFDNLLFAD